MGHLRRRQGRRRQEREYLDYGVQFIDVQWLQRKTTSTSGQKYKNKSILDFNTKDK
jgi:hypothetical protein